MQTTLRSTILAALLLASLPAAHAAEQLWNVSGTLDSGHFAGQSYAGTFSFDDAGLLGSGEEWLPVGTLSLNFAGTAYTLANADAPAEVSFFDGAFLGLSASFSNGDPQFSLIPGWSDISDAFVAYDTVQGFSGAGSLVYAPVPEPEAWAMLLVGLGLVGLRIRKKSTSFHSSKIGA